jgi:hypothetical protein
VNPDGGPDGLVVTVAESGTDLDNGWTGTAMNFPTPANARLDLCMSGCDGSARSVCTLNGSTGRCSLNGAVFGPPLPLLASNVPICVVNRFDGPITGELDLATGRMALGLSLRADVYFTDAARVCPRCAGGRAVGDAGSCDSGGNAGKPCEIESILRVAQSTAADKEFQLSRDCPPDAAEPAGSLRLSIPFTSETTAPLGGGGSVPCGQEPANPYAVVPKDDDCGGAPCNAECTGLACVARTDTGGCVDAKGGVSQLCCANRTTLPCHPVGITRTGLRGVPQPAWPDRSYPKTTAATLAGVFCEPATDNFLVNSSTGLPGPGAVLLPATLTVRAAP